MASHPRRTWDEVSGHLRRRGFPQTVRACRAQFPAVHPGFRFVILPCVNPSGYEGNTLETMHGVNLNRSFGRDSPHQEIRAIESWLEGSGHRFRVTFDLHEAPPDYEGEGFGKSDNPDGTYLYETVTDE